MASPAIIWRNPKAVQKRRLWNQARHIDNQRVYIVVRSGFGNDSAWEGMPNLVMIDGGANARGRSRSGPVR
jgi:hypothetical protein